MEPLRRSHIESLGKYRLPESGKHRVNKNDEEILSRARSEMTHRALLSIRKCPGTSPGIPHQRII
jgi:hypothetical protein